MSNATITLPVTEELMVLLQPYLFGKKPIDTVVYNPPVTNSTPLLSLEEVRAKAVPLSRAGHKDVIKAKITELGAKDMSDLKQEKYEEFMEFLNGL